MIEKKSVVDRLNFSYNGVFDIVEFYKAVEDWKAIHHKEKEIKKKLEEATPSGKNIEWSVELWRFMSHHDKTMIRVKALFSNIKDVQIAKAGFTRTLQHGNVLIILDAFLESDYHHEWIMKPWVYFFRAIIDRYIYNFWTERYVGKLRSETYELHKHINAFFSMYKTYER